jgi:hypothetical protein
VFESPLSVATREYEIVRNREGADFFLALSPYVETLLAKRQIRKVIDGLEKGARRRRSGHGKSKSS